MNNAAIQIKIKQRLNKLASNDYDNIQAWQIVEAFNKGMTDWCRRNLHGTNTKQEGDEQSTRRIDDLQILLKETSPLTVTKRGLFYETVNPLPQDYLQWKRIDVQSTKACCEKPRSMKTYLVEEANITEILRDKNKQPNFEWAETIATLIGNKLRIYTNDEFDIEPPVLTYYRQPRKIEIFGTSNPYTQTTTTVEVPCEFKDDLVELFIDEAVKILAGDIESLVQMQRMGQSVENNN
jgi:hypothetical protein